MHLHVTGMYMKWLVGQHAQKHHHMARMGNTEGANM